jgi:hypothetical protein
LSSRDQQSLTAPISLGRAAGIATGADRQLVGLLVLREIEGLGSGRIVSGLWPSRRSPSAFSAIVRPCSSSSTTLTS